MKIYKYFLMASILGICSSISATKKQEIDINKDSISVINGDDVIYPQVHALYNNSMYADKQIIFKVEDLSKPDEALDEQDLPDIFENIIKADLNKAKGYSEVKNTDINYNIKAHYNGPEKLVNFGNHSFFRGIYSAYADHRPFVLSPDIIWLLISQGFANHVNNNKEELRKQLVNFDEKAILVVHYNSDEIPTWEDMFATFPAQIAHFTGNDLIDNLTHDFTTTTPVIKTVSEVTIMSVTESFFEYQTSWFLCGIPEITLEGTPEDWKKVMEKAKFLKKYKLDWWIDELEPILEEFISTSQGNIKKEFWQNIFKHHEAKMCGDPEIVDGWIVKFFPYLSEGKRTDLKTISLGDKLATEVVKINLQYRFSNGAEDKIIPLEIWAGFIGLLQDKNTFALKPEIGWMVRKNDSQDKALNYYFDNTSSGGFYSFKTKKIPNELLLLKEATDIVIYFTDKIDIPEEMANIKIKGLSLYGEISNKEIERICKMFPDTELEINSIKYNKSIE